MGLKLFKSAGEEEELEEEWGNVSVSRGEWAFRGLGVPRPARLELLLDLPAVPREVQLYNAWSRWDRSPNLCPSGGDGAGEGELTAHRRPTPDSTDCVRGRVSYRRGLHVWRLGWPVGQRGSHAAIGVGTASAPLHAPGYQVLLGGLDGESWGWELGSNRLHRGGTAGSRYPRNPASRDPLPVPESFLAVLDCEEGTLGFVVDGEYLGVAFDGLKGKILYPMVSCVWGNANVTLTYLNGLDGHPPSLTDLCRRCVRRALGETRLPEIKSLPLPTSIRTYLQRS